MKKIDKTDLKRAGSGLLAIFAYFFFSYIETLPFVILGIDVNTLPNRIKIPYL